MPVFDSDGVPIFYERHGEGRPLVLIHGFASSFTRNWVEPGWVRRLTTNGFQVIGPDLRGHGRSGKPHDPAAYRTPVMAGDVLRLLDHLQIERADLLGFSMGGGIALYLGLHHPDRLGKIVVGGVGDALLREEPERIAVIRAALLAPDPAAIGDPMGRLFRDFAERGHNDLAALAAAMSGPGWPGSLEEQRPDHPSGRRPLLFVTAENDPIMLGTTALAQAFPNARFLTLPGCNHNTLVGDRRFKEAALAFLQEAAAL